MQGYNAIMSPATETQGLLRELRGHGFKITGPRVQVVEHVASQDQNFTAEGLAAALAPVGRATVYRTLKLLIDADLVCRIIMNDGSVAYRLSHEAHHHHLVCTSCGATEDIHLSDVEAVMSRVRDATEYEIASHRIEVYGLCPRCRATSTD